MKKNKLKLIENGLIIPFNSLKVIRLAAEYAVILVRAFINDNYDFDLDEDSISEYQAIEIEFSHFFESSKKWDSCIILPFDGIARMNKIIDYSLDCLDSNFYYFIFNKEQEQSQPKNYKKIVRFKKKLLSVYENNRIFNPEKYSKVKELFNF